MSRIFGKFIISESSLVNRAYAFFHHVYGTSTKKEFFLSAREQSIKMIAAHVVFRACEKGHGALRDIDGSLSLSPPNSSRFDHCLSVSHCFLCFVVENWLKLYYNLLQRIRRYETTIIIIIKKNYIPL